MKTYTIRQFSELTGYKVKTLQSWDRKGYLTPGRTPSNRRIYTDRHLEYLLLACQRVPTRATEPDERADVGKASCAPVQIDGVVFSPGKAFLRLIPQKGMVWGELSIQGAEEAAAYLQQWVQKGRRRSAQ